MLSCYGHNMLAAACRRWQLVENETTETIWTPESSEKKSRRDVRRRKYVILIVYCCNSPSIRDIVMLTSSSIMSPYQ